MEKARIGFAREMARKLLKENRIKKPPVDLKAILNKKGYMYLEMDNFLDSVDAIFVNKDGKIYAAVNAKHHVYRQRFSLAHELGHITLCHGEPYYNSCTSLNNPVIKKPHFPIESIFEVEANIFAGELLVPLDILKIEIKKTRDFQELSKIFMVSKEVVGIAINNHMKSLF